MFLSLTHGLCKVPFKRKNVFVGWIQSYRMSVPAGMDRNCVYFGTDPSVWDQLWIEKMTGKSVFDFIEPTLFYQACITGEVTHEFIFISSLLLMGQGSYKGYSYRNVCRL